MSILSTLKETYDSIMEPTETVSPDTIRHKAEELEHGTDLSWHEAVVLVGDELDASNRTIGRIIGRGDATITEIRYDLREKRRNLADETRDGERTLDVLREE